MSEFEWIVPFKGSTRVSADSVATVACRGHKKGSKSEQLHIVLFPSLLQQLQWVCPGDRTGARVAVVFPCETRHAGRCARLRRGDRHQRAMAE